MALPIFEDFLYPFLLATNSKDMSISEMRQYIIDYFHLTDEDCSLRTKSGNSTQVVDRLNWVRQYLRRAQMIEIPERGVYRITQRGKDYLASHDSLRKQVLEECSVVSLRLTIGRKSTKYYLIIIKSWNRFWPYLLICVIKQKPLIIQPIWKTEGNKMRLKDDCLDVFVWSNLSIIQMCCTEDSTNISRLNRFHRTIVWLYKMLLDYVTYDTFDYKRIIRLQSYNLANDKAFALPGTKSHIFLEGAEIVKPRISKFEIKNIILGVPPSGEMRDLLQIINETIFFNAA